MLNLHFLLAYLHPSRAGCVFKNFYACHTPRALPSAKTDLRSIPACRGSCYFVILQRIEEMISSFISDRTGSIFIDVVDCQCDRSAFLGNGFGSTQPLTDADDGFKYIFDMFYAKLMSIQRNNISAICNLYDEARKGEDEVEIAPDDSKFTAEKIMIGGGLPRVGTTIV
jgi:hypothetical protein